MFEFYLNHALGFLILTPLLAALIIGLLPSNEKTCRIVSLIFSIDLLMQAYFLIYSNFDFSLTNLQLIESYNWFGKVIQLKLGADGMSMSMALLMAILLPITIIASEPIAKVKPKLYYSMLMILTASIMGVFLAQDLFLFFLFWELELVPMYLLIAIWGGPNRNYASMKFLIYTFVAGICLLVATLMLFLSSGINTFDMGALTVAARDLPHGVQLTCFVLFFICFLVKLPSIPFHTWLPDAHVEAPTPASMLLAGVLLKMGGYGIYRICAGMFPNILIELSLFIAILGCINILGGAVACLVQDDLKRVIAYSSVSHMGFILLGVASLTPAGFSGGIFQMFSHGLISAALFMLVGTLYERTHTREIVAYGGIAKYMPKCFYLFIFGAMANLALPALSGFVGETLVFYGAISSEVFEAFPSTIGFNFGQICVLFSVLGVILTAGYMLWLVQRVFMGQPNEKWASLTDLRASELVVLGSLTFLIILYGVFPMTLSEVYESSSTALAASIL